MEDIKNITDRWGVEIKRYEIKTIYIDDEFVKLMNLEADSERYKRGKMLNAEAFKVSSLNDAEREKQKFINKKLAEGKSIYLKLEAISKKIKMLRDKIEKEEIS